MIFNIMMGGELKTEEYSTINFNLFKLVTDENPNFNLHFDHLVLQITEVPTTSKY